MACTNMYGLCESDLIARPIYADTVLPKKKMEGGAWSMDFTLFFHLLNLIFFFSLSQELLAVLLHTDWIFLEVQL